MTEDRCSRERALDPRRSFIVQAPAGSGKTELLIQRYLRLLVEVESPEAVVAITFTKKAAAEMRARVLSALKSAEAGVVTDQPHEKTTFEIGRMVLEHDRQMGWKLLSNPTQMRIGTIDALCMAITSQMPWVTRFGALPDVTEKAEELYREAAVNTLVRLEDEERAGVHGPISRLLLHLDNDFSSAKTLVAQMLERREQWLRHTGVSPDLAEVRVELENSLQELIAAEMKTLHALLDADVAIEMTELCGLPSQPAPCVEDLDHWNAFASLVLTKQGELRKVPDRSVFPKNHRQKERCENLLSVLAGEEDLLDGFKRLRELPNPRFEESQWSTMEVVLSILPVAVAELELVFRERRTVDFAELSIRALRALGPEGDPADLALALGYSIEHILVDEYQDTSQTQYDLLKKLTAVWEPGDRRTLFLVGDPMQSIYLFRQADVSLFLMTRREGIGQVQLEPLHLRFNFRSRPEITEWVNSTFATIFPPSEDMDSGAVAYERSDSAGDPAHGESHAVQAQGFFDQAEEALQVVELIRANSNRKVAVLVRARSHLSAIVPALKRAGVRFQAIEIDELGQRPVIQDLMALTFALLHLGDRVSWLAVLRAPWCGLTLNDLHALASPDFNATIWELLDTRAAELSEDGQARIERVRPSLRKALEHRGRSALRDWIEGTWFLLGGPASVREETDLEDATAYFDLLESLEKGAELEDFSWFRQQVSGLFAQPDSTAGDCLQVMTIHKAKGLEFDTVIVPQLDARPRRELAPLLLWQEQAGKALLAPISEAGKPRDPIYNYLRKLEQSRAQNETARLLYVAATRAREQLHLLGCVRTDDKTGTLAAPPRVSFMRLLWQTMSREFVPATPVHPSGTEVKVRQIRRLPARWQAPAPPPPVHWERQADEGATASDITFDWVGDTLRHVGTAVHGYLQRIAREGLEAWDQTRVRSQRASFRVVLANLGVPRGEIDGAVERVEAVLSQVLRDPRGRWALKSREGARCESAITGIIEGREYRAIIDRTFVDEEGVRWIIDYKTSSHEGGNVEAFLDNEKELYRGQLERYARLLAQGETRPIRLGLYFPLLNGWREWAAPEIVMRQASLFESI